MEQNTSNLGTSKVAADNVAFAKNPIDHSMVYRAFVGDLAYKLDFIEERKGLMIEQNANGKGPMVVYFGTGNHGKVNEFRQFLKVNTAMGHSLDGLVSFDVLKPSDYAEIDETGFTFFENSMLKSTGLSMLAGNSAAGRTVMSEDSGIAIDVLDGAPGVFSARYHTMPSCVAMMERLHETYPEIREFLAAKMTEGHRLDSAPAAAKNEVDFVNKLCVIEALRKVNNRVSMSDNVADLDIRGDCIYQPAHFVTASTIAQRGVVEAYGVGTMHGHIAVPIFSDYSSEKNLEAIYHDFGYNAIFHVNGTGHGSPLSDVALEERLKWNHRSMALSGAIVDLLFRQALNCIE